MKTHPWLSRRAAVLAALLVPCTYLPAQTTAAPAAEPAPKDDVLVLSPFEVSADTTEGYAAATTLAGNRLKTDLRDIGSAVTVVTSQFFKDTGATGNTSLLQYLPSAEVGGVNGNFAGTGDAAALSEPDRPSETTRIRGLAVADNTRDFFLTDIPWDSYNIDRIDLQRGPNAILFGQGSPAGIINAGTKGASFKNSGEVELRVGSYGSTRETVDFNQVIIPKQLAIRLDALNDRRSTSRSRRSRTTSGCRAPCASSRRRSTRTATGSSRRPASRAARSIAITRANCRPRTKSRRSSAPVPRAPTRPPTTAGNSGTTSRVGSAAA
ncbi:MAG: TonB-dependent receptor plug domain-containing protein [Lacunisphaera sp.]